MTYPEIHFRSLAPKASLKDGREDLKKFDVPTLILHGDDDQIVSIGASARLSSKIVKNATLRSTKARRAEWRRR